MKWQTETILGINLLVFIFYNIIASIGDDHYNLMYAGLLSLHLFIILGASISQFLNYKPKRGQAYLLSFLLILILGFSICTYLL